MKLEDIAATGNRANTAKIRSQIERIEAALERGLTRQQIFDALKDELSLTCSFEGFLYALKTTRARRKVKQVAPVKIENRLPSDREDFKKRLESTDYSQFEPNEHEQHRKK